MASLNSPFRDELIATANAIAVRGKGILAADESTGTIGKRFESIQLENNEENRRAYRELLFTTKGWGQYCSGVILYEETLGQKTADGTPFVEILKKEGVIPGIKVDKGLTKIPGTQDEDAVSGLDGLATRCQTYYKAGARFAKWRAALKIDPSKGCPSDLAIQENAWGLARYAAICQQNGLCPIVEPEVMMDGTHTLEDCQIATQKVQAAVMKALHDNKIIWEGMLLKPNMVTPGHANPTYKTTPPEEIAKATVATLQRTLPAAVPGVMFLSGGQSEEEATLCLNAMNKITTKVPWSLSFSFGRALQQSTIKTWKGDKANVEAAQAVFLSRCKANSEAQLGKYTGEGASADSKQDLFQKDYKY